MTSLTLGDICYGSWHILIHVHVLLAHRPLCVCVCLLSLQHLSLYFLPRKPLIALLNPSLTSSGKPTLVLQGELGASSLKYPIILYFSSTNVSYLWNLISSFVHLLQ